MFRLRTTACLNVFLVCALLAAPAWAEEPVLRFRRSGEVVAQASLAELKNRIASFTVQLFNPYLDKEKTYEAFSIRDILDFAYDSDWVSHEYSDIAFIALDGYEAVGRLDKLREEGGFLAFRDLDMDQGWEPVGYNKADPGPFFLIWTGRDQTTVNAYPWPWQVGELNILRFADQYPAVVPRGADADSPAWRGFEIFRARCLRCHAMDHQGGRIGPDLNAPQSIAAYRSEHMIKEMIRHPSRYRHTQMPDHGDLSERNLDDLYRYFRFQMDK